MTWILFGLAVFLALASGVYWLVSYGRPTHDPAGVSLMLIAAVGFGYTGLVLRAAGRRAERAAARERQPADGPAGATLPHVRPTIWPFAFSIAALALVVGLVVAGRLLLPVGVALLIASIVGWFVEVGRARRHARDH